MKKILAILLTLVFISMQGAFAAVKVSAGTTIPVSFTNTYSSKDLVSGSIVHGKVTYDVYVGKTLVFKEGAPVIINIDEAKKARCWGNPGEIFILNGAVQDVTGIKRPVEMYHKVTGEERTYPKVLGAISIFFLFPLALFGFVHGGQAEIMANQVINAELLNEFTLD